VSAVIDKKQIAFSGFGQKRREGRLHLAGRCLGVLKVNQLFRGNTLLFEKRYQLRVATVLLREGFKHLAMLPLQGPDHENPGPLRLPVAGLSCGVRVEEEATAQKNQERDSKFARA
jgi:hypothetical protein